MVSVAYDHGRIQGGRMRGMHPPPAIFKNVVAIYNFFIVWNLFDSDKFYALSTNMCEQNASYLAMHKAIRSKNLNKICLKIIQNALK